MKFKEFDVVELPRDIPAAGLLAGMMATILDVYCDPPGYEVEVVDSASETVFIGGISEAELAPLNETEGDSEARKRTDLPSSLSSSLTTPKVSLLGLPLRTLHGSRNTNTRGPRHRHQILWES